MALVTAAWNMDVVEYDSGPYTLLGRIGVLSVLIYLIARLFLTILPLIALRAPVVGSLMDVNWSVYIPHL
jgi:hypothetical protein